MTTIVMNTMTGSVSEYDWAFQSISPGYLGDATGLYAIGGDTDNSLPIIPLVKFGKTLMGGATRSKIDNVYFSITSPSAAGVCIVEGPITTYQYGFVQRADGVSRAEPGKGIRENYLGIGYTNEDGADFRIDQIEVDVQQSVRRI